MGGPGTTVTPSTDGGPTFVPLLVVAGVVWLAFQFRPDKRDVWRYRMSMLAPFGRVFVADVRATWAYLRSFRLREIIRPSWWRERLQFKRVWRGFEEY